MEGVLRSYFEIVVVFSDLTRRVLQPRFLGMRIDLGVSPLSCG